MKTLIIFLLFILLQIGILYVLKIKIKFFVIIKNTNIYFRISIWKMKFNGRFVLLRQDNVKKDKLINKKTNKKRKYIKMLRNIIEVLEIKLLKIDLKIGAIYNFLTIIIVQIFNTFFPMIFNLPFKKKENISYLILPQYNTLQFKGRIEGEIWCSFYNTILILILVWKYK